MARVDFKQWACTNNINRFRVELWDQVAEIEHEACVDTVTFFYSLRDIRILNENDRNSPQSGGVYFTTPIGSSDHRITSGHQSAKAHLAGILLMVARRNYIEDNDAYNFLISLSDIADYIGLTNNEICHELETLDRQGAISIGKPNQIELVDLEALQETAAEPAKRGFGANHAKY